MHLTPVAKGKSGNHLIVRFEIIILHSLEGGSFIQLKWLI